VNQITNIETAPDWSTIRLGIATLTVNILVFVERRCAHYSITNARHWAN